MIGNPYDMALAVRQVDIHTYMPVVKSTEKLSCVRCIFDCCGECESSAVASCGDDNGGVVSA